MRSVHDLAGTERPQCPICAHVDVLAEKVNAAVATQKMRAPRMSAVKAKVVLPIVEAVVPARAVIERDGHGTVRPVMPEPPRVRVPIGDGFTDGEEIAAGSNPLDETSIPPPQPVPAIGLLGLFVLCGLIAVTTASRFRRVTR